MSAPSNDRELLQLAAKSAGVGPVLCYESTRNCLRIGTRSKYRLWRPLTDDGDAMRLAAKLNLSIITNWGFDGNPSGSVGAMLGSREDLELTSTKHGNDPCAAWRRAIVRAAAEIGRAMP